MSSLRVFIQRLLTLALVFLAVGCGCSQTMNSARRRTTTTPTPNPDPTPPESPWTLQFGANLKYYSGADNSEYDSCNSVTTDADGNVYCAGYTGANLAETNGGFGNSDAFVMKTSPLGAVEWIRQIGSDTATASSEVLDAGGNDACNSVALDADGNVYCGGKTNYNLAEVSNGTDDFFVMKLSPAGAVLWVRQLGSTTSTASPHVQSASGQDRCMSIAVDASGVYCGGITSDSLGENTGGAGSGDIVVAKWDLDGDLLWVKHVGADTAAASSEVNSVTSSDYCTALTLDKKDGDVVCVGSTASNFADTHAGLEDALVVKFDKDDGSLLWATQVGSDMATNSAFVLSANQRDGCVSVTTDTDGNIYCGGFTASNLGETAAGSGDAFIAKFDESGNLTWLKHYGQSTSTAEGIDATSYDGFSAIALDEDGNFYVAGTGGWVTTPGNWVWDPMVAKLDSSGSVLWAHQLQGAFLGGRSVEGGEAYSISVDTGGSVVIGGEVVGELSDEPGDSFLNDADIFLMRINNDGTTSLDAPN